MKKLLRILLCFILVLSLLGCGSDDKNAKKTTKASVSASKKTTTSTTSSSSNESTKGKGKVVVLATGGTIAGVGEKGKTAGYKPGSLSADDLLSAVPELKNVADIEAVQVCNVNSDDITAETWLTVAKKINEMSARDDVKGFVVTHGTDTMEETAYFLNLVVKTDKPVVLTGSMRPSTSISADGPMNLYESVCVAASDKAVGQGVLTVFSDKIFSARSVVKTGSKLFLGVKFRAFLIFDIEIGIGVTLSYN